MAVRKGCCWVLHIIHPFSSHKSEVTTSWGTESWCEIAPSYNSQSQSQEAPIRLCVRSAALCQDYGIFVTPVGRKRHQHFSPSPVSPVTRAAVQSEIGMQSHIRCRVILDAESDWMQSHIWRGSATEHTPSGDDSG